MNFSTDEEFARQLDTEDSLRNFRDRGGKRLTYVAGNSLGLLPKAARKIVA